jgi:hypothetical protein
MAHSKEKIEAAIRTLNAQGHVVETQMQDGKTWFAIDGRMRASAEEMQNLADGVYSLAELEELFIQRRIENTSPGELAEEVINAWAVNAQAGHAKDLTRDFKDVAERAFEYRNATQWLDNQRRNFELIAEHTGKPVSDGLLEEPSARERTARTVFLGAYKDYLNKRRIQTTAKAGQ